jgi:ankyrin repeat protein
MFGRAPTTEEVTKMARSATWTEATVESNLVGAVGASVFAVADGDDAWRSMVIQMVHKTVIHKKKTPSQEEQQFFDIEVRTAPALFRRFARQEQPSHKQGSSGEESKIDTIGVQSSWTIRSSYGVERTVTSPAQLALLLLPEIEDQCQARHIAQHVRISPKSSFICIASFSMEQSLASRGLLPCPQCPVWSNGNKSLWWHLQLQHDTAHHAAVETAIYHDTRYSTAIVIYRPPRDETSRRATDEKLIQSVKAPIKNYSRNIATDTPWDAVKRGASLDELKRILLLPSCSSLNQTKKRRFDPQTDRDQHGSLLLHWAAGGGHVILVKYLVDEMVCDASAPQIGHRSFAGRTPLHWAARNGQLQVVDYLLSIDRVRDNIDAATVDGTTAFGWAAWQGHQPILDRLWQAGCNVQSRNRFGCNAALWAAQGRDASPATLQWLSQRGCSVLITNHSRHGVLHKAAQRGHRDLCQWFVVQWLRRPDDGGGSTGAGTCQFWELIGPDCDNSTPSDLAGMEGHEPLAQWLVQMEMTLVLRFSSSTCAIPDWLTPYSSDVRFEWVPGGGVLRMRSVFTNQRKNVYETQT